ncbi:MAG: hypothetical protein Q9M28_00690 [Mariprofundaceae bacterium]|nr:hypothetical protein [Mariprofundaceae bacterium]
MLFFLYFLPMQLCAKPLLEIIDLAWCSGISSHQNLQESNKPIGFYRSGHAPKHAKLYLWMKVQGGQKALDRLKDGKSLRIVQKWQRLVHFQTKTERIKVSIGKKSLSQQTLRRLQHEVNERGYFDWRTWDSKKNFDAKKYTVSFSGYKRKQLDCQDSLNCPMEINIQ